MNPLCRMGFHKWDSWGGGTYRRYYSKGASMERYYIDVTKVCVACRAVQGRARTKVRAVTEGSKKEG